LCRVLASWRSRPGGAVGGLDDRFDVVAHAGDDGCRFGFGVAVGMHDRGVEFGGGGLELVACVAVVGDRGLTAAINPSRLAPMTAVSALAFEHTWRS